MIFPLQPILHVDFLINTVFDDTWGYMVIWCSQIFPLNPVFRKFPCHVWSRPFWVSARCRCINSCALSQLLPQQPRAVPKVTWFGRIWAKAPTEPAWISHASALNVVLHRFWSRHLKICFAMFSIILGRLLSRNNCQILSICPPTQKNRTALVLPVLLRNSLASRQADPPDGNAEKGGDRFPGVGMDVNWPTTLRHDCWFGL
jgi:hypothetical protein